MKDARQLFTGGENHAITTAEALTFMRQYREHFGPEAAPSAFFDQQAVRALLAQPQAVGLRYYYGVDLFGRMLLVLVGAKANRDDLLEGEPLKLSMMNPPLNERGLYDHGQVRHEISLPEAAQLTARYQEALQPGQPKGGFFGKQALHKLLDHGECVGLRCFFGANKAGARVLVMMCVDKFGAEMFHGPMVELSMTCPPFCGWPNLLNSNSRQSSKVIAEFTAPGGRI